MLAIEWIRVLWSKRHDDAETRKLCRDAIKQARGERWHEAHRPKFFAVK